MVRVRNSQYLTSKLFLVVVLYCIVFSIYPADLQESDGGAIHREAITPTCFRRYRDIAILSVVILSLQNQGWDKIKTKPQQILIESGPETIVSIKTLKHKKFLYF